ncbi:hypothetical protein [Pseudomonas anguilliseptica]|uniref:hypothetical protein n=1 Tax=Pseudomonas anguilliseptica TaxID=53406 RepID=UPI00325B4C31
MELHELVEAVKAATDKNALEALVKAELSIDLDKRKSLESLRSEILTGLGVDPAVVEPVPIQPAEQPSVAVVVSDLLPPAEEAEVVAAEVMRNRLLRHQVSGRTFIWTPELAKQPFLEEV